MKQEIKFVAAIALCFGLANTTAQAAAIQSMTIEDIYDTPGWISSSSMNGGAFYYFTPFCCSAMFPTIFVSAGSTDGAILMGAEQGNGAFTNTALFDGAIQLNTLNGAPSGSISDDVMTLDLSGFGGEGHDYAGNRIFLDFSPDSFTLSTQIQKIDDAHYYYTADWSHYAIGADSAESQGLLDYTWVFHLEGVATLAPVPEPETYAMMLAGLGLVGLMVNRRRKLV
jgi:hypothetical protein